MKGDRAGFIELYQKEGKFTFDGVRIAEVVEHSAQSAQETDRAANRLNSLADELRRNVTKFRLAV